MAKTRQGLRARVSQATRGRRKKPASRVERAFDGVKQLVSDTGDRVFSRSGERKTKRKQTSARKTAGDRKRSGRQRQAAAKRAGASRIRSGQRRQAATKKATRARSTSR